MTADLDPEETALFALDPVPAPQTVRYGAHRDQIIDVYQADDPAAPVAILLHGGFWKQEYDRSHYSPYAAHLATRGITALLAEFRRVGPGGDGGWPATFEDVAAAVDLGIELAGDRPVAVAGHSAGGHLALWTAARHQLPPGAPGARTTPVPVHRIVPIAGVADMAVYLATVDAHASIVRLLGGVEAVTANIAFADPMSLLRAHGSTGQPITLVHGVLDTTLPVAQSIGYADADPSVALHALDGVGHYAPIDPRTEAGALVESLLRP
jgi:tryptophan 2,3-dioxygenase